MIGANRQPPPTFEGQFPVMEGRRQGQDRRADQLATGVPPGAAPDPRQQKARHQRQQIAPETLQERGHRRVGHPSALPKLPTLTRRR